MAFTTNGVIAIERIGKPMCFSQLVQNFYMIHSLVMSLCLIYVRGLALLTGNVEIAKKAYFHKCFGEQ